MQKNGNCKELEFISMVSMCTPKYFHMVHFTVDTLNSISRSFISWERIFHVDSQAFTYYYCPQTKFAKVMFLQVSVSHSVHRRGGVVSQHTLQVVSQQALQQVSGGGVVSQHALQVSRPTPMGEG